MSDTLRGSRGRSALMCPMGPRLPGSGLTGAELSLGLSPASQNAGTPQVPGTQLQELEGQTVPANAWDTGWPIASCKTTAQTPLCSRSNLTRVILSQACPDWPKPRPQSQSGCQGRALQAAGPTSPSSPPRALTPWGCQVM